MISRTTFENYIREQGRASQGLKPKPRLALRERDRKFFAKHIQALDFDLLLVLDPAGLDNESQKNIQSHSWLLLERLKNTFSSDADKLCAFGAFLVQRCFLVAVSTCPYTEAKFKGAKFRFRHQEDGVLWRKREVSSYILTTQVLKTAEWTPSVVDQRQKGLLEVLVDHWELA